MVSKGSLIGQTPRLYIREMIPDDLDALYDIHNSWEHIPGIYPLSSDRDEEYVKLKSYIEWMYGFYGTGLFAVCLKENSRVIGQCGAWPSDIFDQWMLELGYVIHKDFCRQGYGFEAMVAVAEYIRTETEFTMAGARIAQGNEASVAIARKLGMKLALDGADRERIYLLDIGGNNETL